MVATVVATMPMDLANTGASTINLQGAQEDDAAAAMALYEAKTLSQQAHYHHDHHRSHGDNDGNGGQAGGLGHGPHTGTSILRLTVGGGVGGQKKNRLEQIQRSRLARSKVQAPFLAGDEGAVTKQNSFAPLAPQLARPPRRANGSYAIRTACGISNP